MKLLSAERVEFFDYLRALARTFVLIVHYRFDLLPGGSIGVAIFFCLSGFLITALLLDEGEMTFWKLWRFLLRRFLRVYPAYLVVVLLLLCMMWLTGSPKLPGLIDALPRLLAFAQMPSTHIGMGVGVFWSLHVEFWFYLSMPFVIMLLGRGHGLLTFVFALIALSYGVKFAPFVFPFPLPGFSPTAFVKWADNLLCGAVVAILAHHRRIKILPTMCALLALGSFTTILAIARFIPNTDRLITWPLEASAASLLTAILIATYLAAPIEVRISPLAWFGRIFYAIYLVHAIPLDYTYSHAWSKWNLILLVIVIAAALHYFVEKPGIRLGRRLSARDALTFPRSATVTNARGTN